MSWWDRYVWRRAEQRQQLTLEQLLAEEGRPTAAGEPVTTETALRLSTVWACVSLLADTVSTLPVDVFRKGEREPLATIPALLQRPSADFDELPDFLWATMASLLLKGNAWGVVTARAGAGMVAAQVDLVHPDRVSVTTDGQGRRVIRVGGVEQDPADLWHVKAYPWPGQLEGLSPIAYARETIGLGLGADRWAARFYGDSAVPAGVLTSDQNITQETAETLSARWEQRHKGRRRVAVLGNGAKFQPITVNPVDFQYIEATQANVAAIARIFRVPPEMVAGTTAGNLAYSSPEMRSADLLQWSVRPWLSRIERALSKLLPRQQHARFNPGAMVRASLRDRYEAHRIAIEAGFLTVDEVRELEDRPPLPPTEGGAVA